MHRLLYLAWLIVVTFGALSFAASAEHRVGPEELILEGGAFGDVPFPHRAHQEKLVDCNTCHRLFPQEAGSIVALKESGKLKKRQVMNECTFCHYDRKKKGEKGGPTSCSGCHKK